MAILNAIIAILARINTVFGYFGKYISLTLIGIMMILVVWQVVLQWFGDAPSWTEEVSIYMMIWITFLVAPIAYRTGANISIEFVKGILKPRARGILELIFAIIIIWILIVLALESLNWIDRGFNTTARTFAVPLGYIYLCMPIGLVFTVLAALEMAIRGLRVLLDRSYLDDPVLNHELDRPESQMTGVSVEVERE
ncbi:MAG: TRAP transporter small permease subunit [Pseudomonadota bacterium]